VAHGAAGRAPRARGAGVSVDFTFRPLTTWPGAPTPPAERRLSPFRAGYSHTLILLRHELEQLDARGPVVVELAVGEDDIRRDGLPRVHARPAHPGVVVSFTSRWGPMRVATDRFDAWQDNLRAIALGLESLRRVDRYGISRSGEQYTGWRQLEAGNGSGDVERGRQLIHKYGTFREALKAVHPDHGGTNADVQAVIAARRAGVE
jgi:hypothetical protein